MPKIAHYDGLADAYDAFVGDHSGYYLHAAAALRRLLGPGSGRCLDLGCGGGHYFPLPLELGWQLVGVDESRDQLRVARGRFPSVELVHADATALPLANASFAAGYSTFTHTDMDEFADAMSEVLRVLAPGARFVYVGSHPCFVGPAQEHGDTGLPRLHPGYRRAGRWETATAPGTTPGGWRQQLGSSVHLPLGTFLTAFAGFAIESVEELEDGWEYPKTIALAFSKP